MGGLNILAIRTRTRSSVTPVAETSSPMWPMWRAGDPETLLSFGGASLVQDMERARVWGPGPQLTRVKNGVNRAAQMCGSEASFWGCEIVLDSSNQHQPGTILKSGCGAAVACIWFFTI